MELAKQTLPLAAHCGGGGKETMKSATTSRRNEREEQGNAGYHTNTAS